MAEAGIVTYRRSEAVKIEMLDPQPSDVTWRLTALAFADVAGYSRLVARDEVGTMELWNRVLRDLLLPGVDRYRGRLLEKPGDAILVEFPSVVYAVNWAIEMQRGLEGIDFQNGRGVAIKLRISVNVDDAIDDNGTLLSNGMNIAARIHQAAHPGEIVLTAIARELVRNRVPASFRSLGAPRLKNVDEPVNLFRVDFSRKAGPTDSDGPYLRWHTRPTLAVLPFRAAGSDEADRYFGEGITEDIITGVSRSRSLFVVSRSSGMRYGDERPDTRAIAEELGVKYLLTGSVRRRAGKLRITANLVQIEESHTIWAKSYDGDAEDLFTFQDQIVSQIVAALEPHVRAAETTRISNRPTESLDAYDCVLKAMSYFYRFSKESYTETRNLLARAIELDPMYAQAHSYLAWSLNFWIGEGHSRELVGDKAAAIAAAQRAIELDPGDAFAMAVRGHLTAFLEGDTRAGADMLERALELDDNSSVAWALSAASAAYRGDCDDARDRLRNVWRLSPYDQLNFFYWVVAGLAEFVAGRYEEAAIWLSRSSRANPRFTASQRLLAATLSLVGDDRGAHQAGLRLLEIEPTFRVSQFVTSYPLKSNASREKLAQGLLAAGLPD